LIVTVLPFSAVTVRPVRLASTVGAIAAGSHASAGTVRAGFDGQIASPVIGKLDGIIDKVRITGAITHLHRSYHHLRVQAGRRRIQEQRISRPNIAGKLVLFPL